MTAESPRKYPIDPSKIERVFAPLREHPCWGLHYSSQLNLSVNFGKPSLLVREPRQIAAKSRAVQRMFARRNVTLRGQWWLWLRMCYWKLSVDDRVLVTFGTASQRRLNCAFGELEGQKLVEVFVNPATGATRFDFDLGCRLECRRFEKKSTTDLWCLYRPRGRALLVCGDGTCIEGLQSEIRSV